MWRTDLTPHLRSIMEGILRDPKANVAVKILTAATASISFNRLEVNKQLVQADPTMKPVWIRVINGQAAIVTEEIVDNSKGGVYLKAWG